jgi:polysaccharide chain length determinant protein (PEP-CTERM system associated)
MPETQSTNVPEDESLDLGQIVRYAKRAIHRGRWWIPLAGLVLLLVTVGGLYFVPDVYRSESTILIVEQQIPQNLVAPLSAITGTQKLNSMTQEVLSRGSLLRIIEDTRLYAGKKALPPDVAVDLMRKSIGITPSDVSRDGSFTSFVISFNASSPGLAQEITRRLALLFIERHSESQTNRANSAATFLGDRLAEKRRRLSELQQQIQTFKIRNAADLPESRLANESRLTEVRGHLQNTTSNLSRAKQQRVVWESTIARSAGTQVNRLKTERAGLLSRLTAKHPKVVAKDEEIEQMERIAASVQSGQPLSQSQASRLAANDPAIGQILAQLEANRLEVETLSKDEKRFEAEVGEAQRHVRMAPALEQQLLGLTREYDTLAAEVGKLDNMAQQSTLSADMERRQQGEQFRQLDPPLLPLKPLSPPRFKICAGAGVGGMIIGFVLLVLSDIRAGHYLTEQQIRRKYSPPLLLSLPELLTPREVRVRRWQTGIGWLAGVMITMAVLVVELYIYRHT